MKVTLLTCTPDPDQLVALPPVSVIPGRIRRDPPGAYC